MQNVNKIQFSKMTTVFSKTYFCGLCSFHNGTRFILNRSHFEQLPSTPNKLNTICAWSSILTAAHYCICENTKHIIYSVYYYILLALFDNLYTPTRYCMDKKKKKGIV